MFWFFIWHFRSSVSLRKKCAGGGVRFYHLWITSGYLFPVFIAQAVKPLALQFHQLIEFQQESKVPQVSNHGPLTVNLNALHYMARDASLYLFICLFIFAETAQFL